MDREQAVKYLPIIQAFAEGKTVQHLKQDGTWKDIDNPGFYRNNAYRIKPEPRKVWIAEYTNGSFSVHTDLGMIATNVSHIEKIHGPFTLED